jgi:hypothetical protein
MLYKTFTSSTVVYGSELWTVSQKAMNMVNSLERKTLRKIFRFMQAKGVCIIRDNEEIYKLYDDMAISTFLCLKRLQWAGHIVRMDDSIAPKDTVGGCFREEVLLESLEVCGRILVGAMP